MVSIGELLVGIALVLGIFTGIARSVILSGAKNLSLPIARFFVAKTAPQNDKLEI